MAVKIFIKRQVPAGKEEQLMDLIRQIRSLAVVQPGYVSGETLRSVANPEDYLVISNWQAIEDWKAWEKSKQRKDIQDRIDELLGKETTYEAYYYPQRAGARLSGFKGWEGG
jgi:heme-degrading monooxygenase HmoA